MPAFTFEKISPPVSGSVSSAAKCSVASTAKKQRGAIVQILDRFVETRVNDTVIEEKGVIDRRQPKSPD